MKKIIALTVALMLLFSSFCLAAVSSSKSSTSRPSTKSSTSSTIPSTSQTQKAASSDSGYKPSAPANSYSDKAPTSQVKPGTQQTQPQQNSGGFWRTFGSFGAGMLAGSLLSNLFGWGHMGAMSSLFGVLFNILMILAVIAVVRFIWNKVRGQDRRNM